MGKKSSLPDNSHTSKGSNRCKLALPHAYKPYIVVQFFTIAAVLLLIALFPARYTHAGWLIAAGGAYALAKVFEALDGPIFDILKISGHTLKHLTASVTAFFIVIMLKRREATEVPVLK